MMRSSGPSLDELVGTVERFAGDPATTSRVVAALGGAASQLVYSGFAAGVSPDGTRWAPLKRPRAGLGGALLLRGDLRAEASLVHYTAGGFSLRVDDPKSVHQRGYRPRNLPARPFYPPAVLPYAWHRVMEAAADAALDVDG